MASNFKHPKRISNKLGAPKIVRPASVNVGDVLPSNSPPNLDEVRLITFHFNPTRFKRPVEGYIRWRDALKLPVECWELTIDGAEPEIPGSIIVNGCSDNILWQKERLFNLALSRLPNSVKYVAWLDHDLVFENPNWLINAIAQLENGADTLQLFSQLRYLKADDSFDFERDAAVYVTLAQGRMATCAPGGAWIARRSWLDAIGGIYDRNIVGGGDAVWFEAVTKCSQGNYLMRQPPKLRESCSAWIDTIGPVNYGFVPGRVIHLWHGDRKNRQYISRDTITCKYDFDPAIHIHIDENGLLRWSPGVPEEFKKDIQRFFAARDEDGAAVVAAVNKHPAPITAPVVRGIRRLRGRTGPDVLHAGVTTQGSDNAASNQRG